MPQQTGNKTNINKTKTKNAHALLYTSAFC